MPPLSVMLVAGVGMDALINTLWFLCGVVPGHVHGFYVTWTYFSRKRKVRRGRWPGGPKPFIYSRRVVNGDAGDDEVRRLWRAREQREKGAGGGPGGWGGGWGARRGSRRGGGGGAPAVQVGSRASRRQSEVVGGHERW